MQPQLLVHLVTNKKKRMESENIDGEVNPLDSREIVQCTIAKNGSHL